MMSLLFRPAVFKVLMLFSLEPGKKFTRKEIKEHTKLNNVPLDSALRLLEASGVISRERRMYKLDFERGEMIVELVRKEHAKFNRIPLRAYFAVVDIAERLAKEKCDVYLFGSYAKGSFTAESDLDIAVISAKDVDLGFVKRFEKKYQIKIEVHSFGTEFYRHRSDKFVREVLEGIRIIKNL